MYVVQHPIFAILGDSTALLPPARKPSMTPTPATPTSANSSKGSKERSAQTDGVDVDLTGDKTRDKCVELIYNALASDSGARE